MSHPRRGIAALAIVGLLGLAVASPDAVASGRGPGFSGAVLTRTIRAAIQKAHIPGVIVGVWRGDRQLYRRGIGVQSLVTRRPMTANLGMRIGSVTKCFVTTGVLQLVDRGKIRLDDPISKYVSGVPDGDSITIRQLAAMRSGLYSYTSALIPKVLASHPERQWTVSQLLNISYSHPPEFAPGTAFDYSNTNTVLLGLVIERVSGQPLRKYLEQKIIRPLGLTRTFLPRGAEFPEPHPQGYTNWTPQGFGPPNGRLLNSTDWNPSWGWAAGAMVSTLDDLHKWAVAAGTGRLISRASFRARKHFLPAPGEGGSTYGLNFMKYGAWIGHDGNLAGYISFPFYLPAQRTTLVVLFNSNAAVLGAVTLMRTITKIITPKHLWPIPPPE